MNKSAFFLIGTFLFSHVETELGVVYFKILFHWNLKVHFVYQKPLNISRD